MRHGLGLILALGLGSVLVSGRALSQAAAGAAMLNFPLSVRQMGMGNVSVGGRDVLRAWSNPALLAEMATQGEVAVSGSSMFAGAQQTFGLGGGWLLTPSLAVGGLLSSLSFDFAELNAFGEQKGEIAQRVLAGGLMGAVRFDWLRVGVLLKGVTDELAGNSTNTSAADLGAVAFWKDVSFGLAVRNLGSELRSAEKSSKDGEALPREIRVGASYRYQPWRVAVGVEHLEAVDRDGRQAAGVEWWPSNSFGLRAGIDSLNQQEMQTTFGLSAVLNEFGLDYALGVHPLGPTHRFNVSYAFGLRAGEITAHFPVPLPPQKADEVPLPEQSVPEPPLQEIPLPPRKQAVPSRRPTKATVEKSQREIELEREIKRERRLLELERETRKLRREQQGGKKPAGQP